VSFATTDAVFSAFPAMFATNTFVGTADKNTVQLSGSLNVSGTLPATPVAYSASGLTVTSGVTVIIQAGAVIQSSFDALITVDGDLEAIGTAEAPIIFTTQTPKSGNRWRGLRINNKTAANPTRLNAAIVEFAGSFGESAVRLSNADSRIENSLIVDNNNDGIELLSGSDAVITGSSIVRNLGHGVTMTSSNPVLDMNSIFNNAQNGAQNNTCPAASSLIDAENNYWGDDTGPNDSSDDRVGGGLLNATGLGDEVSDCVDYLPWIRLGPSVEGTISVVSGGGQSGMVGTVLPQPLVVEIRSLPPNDLPLENIDVTFSIMEGDGSIVETQPVRTDIDGRASAQVRLGLTPGPVTVTVTARDVNSPLALFTAAGTPNGGLLGFALEATPLELAIRPGKRGGVGDVNNDGKVNNSDAQLTLLDKPAVAPYVRVIWCGVARVIRGIPMGGRCFLHGYSRLVLAERRW
jgi:hypothetical protein